MQYKFSEQIYNKTTIKEKFNYYLLEKESSSATIKKYQCDIEKFLNFMNIKKYQSLTKEVLLEYKEYLIKKYAIRSVNSMLAALNQLLECFQLGNLKIKSLKYQRSMFQKEDKYLTKKEYYIILKETKNKMLKMIIEAIAETGVRVSELKFFTVEQIKKGIIEIYNKGKYRAILIPKKIKEKLLLFSKKLGITSGIIFRTKTGKSIDRSNIWKMLQNLSKITKIEKEKLFPHNLRHFFAQMFYNKTKNLVMLGDILGHSSLETTRIYACGTLKQYKKILNQFNDNFYNLLVNT